MPPTRIFLTGATGYLGGEALHQLSHHPSLPLSLRCLVRTHPQAKSLTSAHPKVEVVTGDLDDSKLITTESRGADIVVHLASTKHEVSSKAIAAGLAARTKETGRVGHWIQIGGASMFAGPEIQEGRYGEATDKVWDDVKDLGEIEKVVRQQKGRVVDNLVLDQKATEVKTALIPGPLIYGKGRGTGNTRSIQAPTLVKWALEHGGEGVMVGKGEAAWSSVHVGDVGGLIVRLVERAVEGEEAGWNGEGVYFPETGMLVSTDPSSYKIYLGHTNFASQNFKDIAKLISEEVVKAGYAKETSTKSLDKDQAEEIMPHAAVLLGTNARLKGTRARKVGWTQGGISLEEEIKELVQREAKDLGKKSAAL